MHLKTHDQTTDQVHRGTVTTYIVPWYDVDLSTPRMDGPVPLPGIRVADVERSGRWGSKEELLPRMECQRRG